MMSIKFYTCIECGEPIHDRDSRCRSCFSKAWRAEGNPAWKGNDAEESAGRHRAQRRVAITGDCERCHEAKAIDRHHIDGNTLNNERSNIQLLCRRCHMTIDGRLQKLAAQAKTANAARHAKR